ncbi:hypothetical protein FHP29_10440 [Nocardioides albidus]|uniref:Uncharacterized protein n=1 Tax=Nocardioides albidus TaxID=1517589 RepID=A0A5C4VX26_9ACTN|nr:hypothetical protein [Nocardioides albidus]TNM40460.1 hypothetical protein FHP29_10440 [Nocardioides albidus]
MLLPEMYDGFTAAVARATPTGLGLVQEAIDAAIAKIDMMEQDKRLDPAEFSAATFIPKSAFGAADRSPEIALHHTRAHAVMTDTLKGVRADLVNFRAACVAARDDIVGVDDDAAAAFIASRNAVTAVGRADTDNAQSAYQQAVNDNAGVVPTEHNPDSQEGQEGGDDGR